MALGFRGIPDAVDGGGFGGERGLRQSRGERRRRGSGRRRGDRRRRVEKGGGMEKVPLQMVALISEGVEGVLPQQIPGLFFMLSFMILEKTFPWTLGSLGVPSHLC